LSDENAEIADWLVRLTHNHKDWGFGLCRDYIRKVKGLSWNHKRICRNCSELELNLRIKPRRRTQREKPVPLTVPEALPILEGLFGKTFVSLRFLSACL